MRGRLDSWVNMSGKIILKTQSKKTGRGKISIAIITVLLCITSGVLYFQLWKKPLTVESGIAKHYFTFTGHSGTVWDAAFSPDGEMLASGSVDGTVKIWQKKDGQIARTLQHPMGVTALAYSPDGNYLATGSYDSYVRLWRVADGALLKTFSGHSETVWAVAFSPDGKTIASGGEDTSIKLWDVAQGSLLRTLEGHALNVWAVAFSPDGSRLASGSFDKTIKLWKVNDGQLISTIAAHSEAVLSVAFSKDGQYLVSGGDDRAVKLWNAKDGSLIRSFQGDSEHIYSVAISPDGKRILSGGRDRNSFGELLQNIFGVSETNKWVTVRLWNVADGRLIQTFDQHSNDVYAVAFSPDGAWFASASEDKTVSLWHLL
jgi:WD40 repeat protein